jgi:hypothetical protein
VTSTDPSHVSLGGIAIALVTVSAGAAAGLAFVPVVGTALGTLAGGFVAGLTVEDRPVVESGTAGVLAGLGVLVAGTLVGNGLVAALLALFSIDPVTLLVSAALNFAVGAFGAHFGADLRDGLTEPVEEPSRSRARGPVRPRPTDDASSDTDDASADTDATEASREDSDRMHSDETVALEGAEKSDR